MTIPLGSLAEKWGRSVILGLNLVSRGFVLLWAIVLGYFHELLPTSDIVAGLILSVLVVSSIPSFTPLFPTSPIIVSSELSTLDI